MKRATTISTTALIAASLAIGAHTPQVAVSAPAATAAPTTIASSPTRLRPSPSPSSEPPPSEPSESTVPTITPSAPELLEFEGGDIFGDVTAGGGWVWIATIRGLIQVDPSEMTATWHLILAPGRPITFGFDSVWVANFDTGEVNRVDPESLTVIATINVDGGPDGILATDDGIWVTQHYQGTISRIDAGSNEVVETITVATPGERGPMDPALIGGDIWFAVPNGPSVVRVDREGNVTTIPISDTAGFGVPVATTDAIWLTSPDPTVNPTVTRIDRTTGNVTYPELPEEVIDNGGASAGVVIDGTLWFTTPGDLMVAVDPSTLAVTATVPLRGAIPRNVIVYQDAVWVMSEAGGSLERIAVERFTTAAS